MEDHNMKQYVRYIPPIHELQKGKKYNELLQQFELDENQLTTAVKETVDECRNLILQEKWSGPIPGDEQFISYLFNKVEKNLHKQFQYTLKKVINATGVIIHTNLGRAPLSQRAIRHVVETAESYSNLEYDLEKGSRGSRHSHVEKLLRKITGAESAMVVNNNAAAVYLVLREFAKDKEVIVSRGELVEIGGSFRISSIMEESGARLVEVGTTNKTHLYDYERAITEDTAMILKVHKSNFKMVGFTESVSSDQLAQITSKHENIILYEDLGSGALYDYTQHGIGSEPVVRDILKNGVHIASFSGDKLLGGPQAGIIVGKKELINRLKKNQLARVVRVDKMTLAALEGTLLDYLKGNEKVKQIPVVKGLLMSQNEMKERTTKFIHALSNKTNNYEISLQESVSQVGGGTMPGVDLPSFSAFLKHSNLSAQTIAQKLRLEHEPAIIVRIQNEGIIIDLRCVTEEEEQIMLEALANL